MRDLTSLPSAWNPQGLSAQAVTNLVNCHGGSAAIDYRIDLLVWSPQLGTLSGVAVPGAPAGFPYDISPYVKSLKIEKNSTRDVTGSADVVIQGLEGTGVQINPLLHCFRVYQLYYDGSGTILLDVPIYTGSFATFDAELNDDTKVWKGKSYDLSYRFSVLDFINPCTWNAGTRITDIMTWLLEASPFPLSVGGTGQTPSSTVISNATNGQGGGYCATGVAVSDPRSFYTPISNGSTVSSSPVLNNPAGVTVYVRNDIGIKINPTTWHIVDPWGCGDMPLTNVSGLGWCFVPNRQAGGQQLYFTVQSTTPGCQFVTASGTQYDPITLTTITNNGPSDAFTRLGGDGGVPANTPSYSYSTGGCDHAGPGYAASTVVVPPCVQTLPAVLMLDPKSGGQLKQFNEQLCDAIAYTHLWQREGTDLQVEFHSEPVWIYSAQGVPPAGWTYSTDSDSVIKPPVQQQLLDMSQVKNYIEVRSENSNAAPVYAAQKNTSANSSVSIGRIGVFSKTIKNDQITDAYTANLVAYAQLQASSALNERITMRVVSNPFIELYDHLSVLVRDKGTWQYTGSGTSLDAVYTPGNTLSIDPTAGPFRIESYTVDCLTHEMQLSLSRPLLI